MNNATAKLIALPFLRVFAAFFPLDGESIAVTTYIYMLHRTYTCVMAQNVIILMFITYLRGKQNKVHLHYVLVIRNVYLSYDNGW